MEVYFAPFASIGANLQLSALGDALAVNSDQFQAPRYVAISIRLGGPLELIGPGRLLNPFFHCEKFYGVSIDSLVLRTSIWRPHFTSYEMAHSNADFEMSLSPSLPSS